MIDVSKIESLKSELKKIKFERDTYQQNLDLLLKKNKRLFNYFSHKEMNKLFEEDKVRISFATVLLDLEIIHIFKRLFEMHVFDYIVDRQNPDNKTEAYTQTLISICKRFTDCVIDDQIHKEMLSPQKFKIEFNNFINQYIERNIN